MSSSGSGVYLLHAGPAPLALDEIGGIQGAHTTFAGAKKAAHALAARQEEFGDNQIVIVTASPTGLWNDGLFNLKHMFPGDAEPPDHSAVYYVHRGKSGHGPPVGQMRRVEEVQFVLFGLKGWIPGWIQLLFLVMVAAVVVFIMVR